MNKVCNLAIFVSGSGTNCENIIRYFKDDSSVNIKIVISNRADAYALTRATNLGVKNTVITRQQFNDEPQTVLEQVEGCDYIILAGFLLKVPDYLIEAFPNRIINLHPALLPKYGGKGMYGHHVHEAVKAAGESETGITIHYVNNVIDGGQIIEQFKTSLTPDDTIEDIEQKIHILEQGNFPQVIERVIKKQ
ncbi:MAG: phosphoribosylglycinamide formyltransferase [Prevotella sp.]|jgi:phosphoribosylglycinamide formyltransferase-1|nr:phosphoribosylglycinamide formyltransferase [Prevotella sp.]